MRTGHWSGVTAAAACLVLAGCTLGPAPVGPAQAVALLRTGKPLLRCREACLAAWRQAQPGAARLARERRWADLAALVESTGYQDDLSLYYLGRAAEGIGDPGAGASYYRQSMAVSGTAIACKNLSHLCAGLSFPRAAARRLAAIDRELARRFGRRRPTGQPPEAAPAEADEASSPAPAPLSPAGPPASEYIEPPPAVPAVR